MTEKPDLRYVGIQKSAVNLLWKAVDYDDQTMLWLLTMLIHHCSDKLCQEVGSEAEFTRPRRRGVFVHF